MDRMCSEGNGCNHNHKTLCGRYDPDASYYIDDEVMVGMFVAWQCDNCGAILPDEVSGDDLYRDDLPALDMDAHRSTIQANVDRVFPRRSELTAVNFFGRGIR